MINIAIDNLWDIFSYSYIEHLYYTNIPSNYDNRSGQNVTLDISSDKPIAHFVTLLTIMSILNVMHAISCY